LGRSFFRPAGLTSEVPPEHEVEHEKAVLVVLEGITQIDNEGVIDLREDDMRCEPRLKAGGGHAGRSVATDLFE